MIKPEYLYQPSLFVRRVLEAVGFGRDFPCEVELSWGITIRLPWDDSITRALCRRRVYDLPVSEVLWRLLDPGDSVADVGAYIGIFTGLAARRASEAGRVHAYEPHSRTHRALLENVGRWRDVPGTAEVTVTRAAVGREPGTAVLKEPKHYYRNRGTAYVEAGGSDVEDGTDRGIRVKQITLDQIMNADSPFDVIKLDVEGREPAVIDGAEAAVGKGGARDVVYEAERQSAAGVSAELARRGYTVFGIDGTWRGPRLIRFDAEGDGGSHVWASHLPTSHLATRAPSRAVARLRGQGWSCLRASGT